MQHLLQRMFEKSNLLQPWRLEVAEPPKLNPHFGKLSDHLRGLKNPFFHESTQVDFACVVANYIRPKLFKQPLNFYKSNLPGNQIYVYFPWL